VRDQSLSTFDVRGQLLQSATSDAGWAMARHWGRAPARSETSCGQQARRGNPLSLWLFSGKTSAAYQPSGVRHVVWRRCHRDFPHRIRTHRRDRRHSLSSNRGHALACRNAACERCARSCFWGSRSFALVGPGGAGAALQGRCDTLRLRPRTPPIPKIADVDPADQVMRRRPPLQQERQRPPRRKEGERLGRRRVRTDQKEVSAPITTACL
jgi:hypothetical protein